MKNFFLDTEFIANAETCSVKPLSIALVDEPGNSLYIVISDAPRHEGDEFVQEHVIPYLDIAPFPGYEMQDQIQVHLDKETGTDHTFMSTNRKTAGALIKFWVDSFQQQPRFTAWYASYDWVVFCDLLGGFINLPAGWPQYVNDWRWTRTRLQEYKGSLTVPEHHCLRDAFQLQQSVLGI